LAAISVMSAMCNVELLYCARTLKIQKLLLKVGKYKIMWGLCSKWDPFHSLSQTLQVNVRILLAGTSYL